MLKLFWSVGVYVAAVRLQFRYRGEHEARDMRGLFPDWTIEPNAVVSIRRHPVVLIKAIAMAEFGVLSAIVVSVPSQCSLSGMRLGTLLGIGSMARVENQDMAHWHLHSDCRAVRSAALVHKSGAL